MVVVWGPLPSLRRETAKDLVRDVQWANQTAKVGWGVQGLLPRGEKDLAAVRALTRSRKVGFNQILATADSAGTLSLLHFPSPEPEALRRSAQVKPHAAR